APSVGLVAGDERLEAGSCDIVGALFGRGLHQVRTGRQQRTPDATVQGDPGGPDRVDDDACGVRRVPHLELVLQVDRDVTEGAALQPDIGPLAVVEPLDVVTGTDVDVARAQFTVHVRGDRPGLGDLLRL